MKEKEYFAVFLKKFFCRPALQESVTAAVLKAGHSTRDRFAAKYLIVSGIQIRHFLGGGFMNQPIKKHSLC